MSSELEAKLHNRLYQWAQWVKSGNRLNIGYPKQSTIYSMMLTGGAFIQNAGYVGYVSTLYDLDAEATEQLLKMLKKASSALHAAITEYYLADKAEDAAKRLGICVRVLQNRVKEARAFLLGALAGKEELRVAA